MYISNILSNGTSQILSRFPCISKPMTLFKTGCFLSQNVDQKNGACMVKQSIKMYVLFGGAQLLKGKHWSFS